MVGFPAKVFPWDSMRSKSPWMIGCAAPSAEFDEINRRMLMVAKLIAHDIDKRKE